MIRCRRADGGVLADKETHAVLAVGCLIPFALLAVGAAVGSYIGNINGGYWGAGVGFLAGLLVVVAGFVLIDRSAKE
jgi:hypothetical protein